MDTPHVTQFVMAAPKRFPCADCSTTPRTRVDWDVFPFQLSFRLKMGGFMFSGPHLVDDIDSFFDQPKNRIRLALQGSVEATSKSNACNKASNHLTFQSPRTISRSPDILCYPLTFFGGHFQCFLPWNSWGKYSFAVVMSSPLRGHHSMLKFGSFQHQKPFLVSLSNANCSWIHGYFQTLLLSSIYIGGALGTDAIHDQWEKDNKRWHSHRHLTKTNELPGLAEQTPAPVGMVRIITVHL